MAGGFSGTFDDREQAIGWQIFQDVLAAAEPADFDAIDAVARAETEVQTRSEVTLVPAAAMHLGNLDQIAGHNRDARSNSVAIGTDAQQTQLNPVVSAG